MRFYDTSIDNVEEKQAGIDFFVPIDVLVDLVEFVHGERCELGVVVFQSLREVLNGQFIWFVQIVLVKRFIVDIVFDEVPIET